LAAQCSEAEGDGREVCGAYFSTHCSIGTAPAIARRSAPPRPRSHYQLPAHACARSWTPFSVIVSLFDERIDLFPGGALLLISSFADPEKVRGSRTGSQLQKDLFCVCPLIEAADLQLVADFSRAQW
jgi:hypothetical protein